MTSIPIITVYIIPFSPIFAVIWSFKKMFPEFCWRNFPKICFRKLQKMMIGIGLILQQNVLHSPQSRISNILQCKSLQLDYRQTKLHWCCFFIENSQSKNCYNTVVISDKNIFPNWFRISIYRKKQNLWTNISEFSK